MNTTLEKLCQFGAVPVLISFIMLFLFAFSESVTYYVLLYDQCLSSVISDGSEKWISTFSLLPPYR